KILRGILVIILQIILLNGGIISKLELLKILSKYNINLILSKINNNNNNNNIYKLLFQFKKEKYLEEICEKENNNLINTTTINNDNHIFYKWGIKSYIITSKSNLYTHAYKL